MSQEWLEKPRVIPRTLPFGFPTLSYPTFLLGSLHALFFSLPRALPGVVDVFGVPTTKAGLRKRRRRESMFFWFRAPEKKKKHKKRKEQKNNKERKRTQTPSFFKIGFWGSHNQDRSPQEKEEAEALARRTRSWRPSRPSSRRRRGRPCCGWT